MAHIVEFAVKGLAGYKGTFHRKLNPDVNIFFGENGSGKTTLLKILHAALENDTDILRNLPFVEAEVKVYSRRDNMAFSRSIAQRREVDPADSVSDSLTASPRLGRLFRPSMPAWQWQSVPPEPEPPFGPESGITRWKHGYLPISRLYRGLSPSGTLIGFASIGKTRTELSEEELDQAFATSLQKLWSDYYADISTAVQQIQQEGLAAILQTILLPSDSEAKSTAEDDVHEAYRRVADFLTRQPQFSHVLGTETQFEKAYRTNNQLRSVVQHIENVEESLKRENAPQEQLRSLLNSLFSNHKQVVFDGKQIRILSEENTTINLPLLSSGEKQLIVLALEALITGYHVLLIDEPELSMHVDWQRRLVSSLMTLNPNMQLIMTTHSPDIMAELPDSQIFRIWPD